MAERIWIEEAGSDPYADNADPYAEGVGVSDYGQSLKSGAAGIGSFIGSSLRALGESRDSDDKKSLQASQYLGEALQELFGNMEENALADMSPDAARRIQSTVTDPEFWSLTALSLKATQMTPELAASVVPAVLMPGALAGAAALAATGGAFSAASVVDELYSMTDELSDADLQAQVPAYRSLRTEGMDKEKARAQYNEQLRGMKPLIAGLVGAVTNVVGPAGQLTRGIRGVGANLTGEAGEGVATRIGKGFAEGAGSEAVEGTAESGAIETGRSELTGAPVDIGNIATSAAEGAVLGGILGGAVGGVAGGPRHARTNDAEVAVGGPEAARPALVDHALGVPPAENGGIAPSNPQAPNQPTGIGPVEGPAASTAPGQAPVTSHQPSRSEAASVSAAPVVDPAVAPSGVNVADPSGVDPAHRAAMDAYNSDVVAEPSPVDPIAPTRQTAVDRPVEPVAPAPTPAPIDPNMSAPTPEPVTTGGNIAPVPESPPVAEAPVRAPLAEPAPIQQAPGPRILEDPNAVNEFDAKIGRNLESMNAPVVDEPVGGSKFSIAQREQRKATRDGSLRIAAKYPPVEAENGVFSKRPNEIIAGRNLVLDRARAMVDEANSEGLTIPRTFKDTKDPAEQYNPETLLLMEAKRLVAAADAKKAKVSNFQTFKTRELDIRSGAGRDAVAERRSEGDANTRTSGDVDVGTLTDTDAPADASTPEAVLMANEEEGLTSRGRTATRSESIPTRVQEAIDASIELAQRKPSQPKVETRKRRVVAKPAERPVVTPKVTEARARLALKPKVEEAAPAPKPATPKVQQIKERQVAARADTNTNPSVAQVQAGNYAKGEVAMHGVTVRIENPKGSVRSNKDPNGPKWSVKLKNDYGYIAGTKGADGDPIDVYLGDNHDATYVYVVDQVDPDSRVFDEHKVMMGFKSEAAAYNAYDAGFSDGSGMMRIGGITKMTMDEFKAWANSDPKDRSGMTAEDEASLRSLMIDDEFDAYVSEADVVLDGMVADPVTGRTAIPLSSHKAADLIRGLSLMDLSGPERVMGGNAKSILARVVGDVDVHVLSAEDIRRISGYESYGAGSPRGYHGYKGGREAVFIRADQMADPAALRHVLLHEVTHAATVRAINENPAVRADVERLMRAAQQGIAQGMRSGHFTMAEFNAMQYGMTQPVEFVAEVFSNPDFQRVLARIQVPESMSRAYGLGNPVRSLWDAFIRSVGKAIGLPGAANSLLEAAIRVTETSMKPRFDQAIALEDASDASFLVDGNLKPLKKAMKAARDSVVTRPDLQASAGRPWLLGMRTLDHIGRAAARYFGPNNPVARIARLMEAQRVAAIREFDKAAPLIQRMKDLETKYSKVRGENGQSVWENATQLMTDETNASVYADRPLYEQSHISKTGRKDSWFRAQHPELSRRYEALPEDIKEMRREALDFYRDKQNEASLKLMKNQIIHLFDVPDAEAMAARIHDGTATDADKALLGDAYDVIVSAGTLSKINGPYFPQMRRGNWVVKGRVKVTSPGNARMISGNEFEFDTADAAAAWAAEQSGRPTMRTVYVDKNTGERFGMDNGVQVPLTGQDVNAEAKYRVVVQDRYMEMFDSEKEARAQAALLAKEGLQVDDVLPRSFDNFGIQADALSSQMQRLMSVLERKADDRGYTDQQKHDMMTSMNEMSLSMLGSTRLQSRSLPRRNVQGASKDFVRNIVDYTHSMGNYIAKLDHRQGVDNAIQEMTDYIKANERDGMSAGRTAIANEVKRRVASSNPAQETSSVAPVVNRVLALSFIDKLMSPAYSVINATQPMMISAPYLASHYGLTKTYSAMSKAYNDIGSLKSIQEGFAATITKAKSGTQIPTDPVSLIRERLKDAGEKTMLDVMVEWGAIDTDAGLEVGTIVRSSKGIVGKLDNGIGYLEGIARQMPKSIEAINRTTVALASYRLEMARSGDVAKATQFAYDTINMTQFNYSASNTPRLMGSHPVLKLALQFKKYGVGMYQFLGEQATIAIRNENPGDRAQAIKALSMTIGMHVLVAGAAGLPTEPIKMVVMVANQLGLTDWSWGDVENAQREAMAGLFGKDLGEAVTRGIPRLAGIDLSTRMGIDTLVGPFGEPRSNEAQDLKAYVWDAVSGAPAGLVLDWVKGVNSLASGDVDRAMERLVPIKAFSDSVKAYRQMTEGTISEKTGKQVMSPYSTMEAISKGLGFAPAREAEAFERSSMFYRNKDKQTEVRSSFQREWIEAGSAAKGRVWREIQKYNRTQPMEARITMKDLRGYEKRMKQDIKSTKEGLRARKREQHLIDRADSTFNFE